jgi:hypothetical protein
MSTSDPWRQIALPSPRSNMNARRVDSNLRWDFYWALGSDTHPRLLLHHADRAVGQMPQLKGMGVHEIEDGKGGYYLELELTDPSLRDVFYGLCRDVTTACKDATTDSSAVEMAVSRTWHWHRLLMGGGALLGPEVQKGLAGELVVLCRLLSHMPSSGAVSAWMGPLNSPKDFELGSLAIEVKARRGLAIPQVKISSEHQLDPQALDMLILHVVELASAAPGCGFTVVGLAEETRALIAAGDEAAVGLFDGRLATIGLDLEADYEDFRWELTGQTSYCVSGEFPRVIASALPLGLSRVRYALDLNAIADFAISDQELDSYIARAVKP